MVLVELVLHMDLAAAAVDLATLLLAQMGVQANLGLF
jgi:hypothetical protein